MYLEILDQMMDEHHEEFSCESLKGRALFKTDYNSLNNTVAIFRWEECILLNDGPPGIPSESPPATHSIVSLWRNSMRGPIGWHAS